MSTIARWQTRAHWDKEFSGSTNYASMRAYIISWLAVHNGDDGQPTQLGDFADRSVQVEGTFSGASCHIEGSNDGENYHILTDGEGNPLSLTEAGLYWIKEAVAYLRPRVADGDGSTNLNVIVFARG